MSRSDSGRPVLREFLARGFLQAYAEFVGEATADDAAEGTPYLCPTCNSLPLLGVLRPEGDGGRRFLHCAFARTSGASAEFCAQRAARSARINCRCLWRSNFRMFAWMLAIRANTTSGQLI